MINEDNKIISDTPLILDEANYLKDETEEIYLPDGEVYKSYEGTYYQESTDCDTFIKSKAKTIGKITGVGVSSMGLLTFVVAVIFSMMTNNPFSPSITNPNIEIHMNEQELSYSFSFTNPYGISMYCDLEDENQNGIEKTLITGLGTFEGMFKGLEYGVDYTLVVYSEQYNSKVYYYIGDKVRL